MEGKAWAGNAKVAHVAALNEKGRSWRKELAPLIAGGKGVDGKVDGLWTCRRGSEVFVFNSTSKEVEISVDGEQVKLAPYTIWSNKMLAAK